MHGFLAAVRLMVTRIMAVLAAICLVAAFTLATVIPPFESLAELLAAVDHPLLVALTRAGETNLPHWVWAGMVVPILLRPAWLGPAGLGLIMIGFAVTLATRKSVARSHRRRS